MTLDRSVSFTLALLTLGFAGAAPAAPKAKPSNAAITTEEACRSTFQRERACTDAFLPKLVELRVRLDLPKGIAASDVKEGRAALVAAARREWERDSTDQAIAETCQGAASAMPAPAQEDVRKTAEACLAKKGCDEFVACILPLNERMLRARAGK